MTKLTVNSKSNALAVAIVAIATGVVVAIIVANFPLKRITDYWGSEFDDNDDDDDDDDDLYNNKQQKKPFVSLLDHISSRRDESSQKNVGNLVTCSHVVLPMTKKGMKKQLKYERKVQDRKMKKQKERQKRHQDAIIMGRNIQEEQDLVTQRTMNGDGWRRRQMIWEMEKLAWVKQSFHICIDCSYELYMTRKEITSLAAQIRCCYAYNKRNDQPCQMIVTNMSTQQSPQTLHLLQQEKGYDEWSNRAYVSTSLSPYEYYSKNDYNSIKLDTDEATSSKDEPQQHRISKMVYLTSDSDNTLLTLENDTVYVIGGIVDRNRYKGIAHIRALELSRNLGNDKDDDGMMLSVSTAKLPLMEYIAHMPSTPVLTINHVFHILLQYRNYNNDWNAAFRAILPARKEAQYIF